MAEKVNLRPAPIKIGSNTSISNSFHPRPLQSIQPNLYPLMAKVVRNSLKKEPRWENISIFWRFCQILVNGNDDDNDDNGDDDDDDDDNDVYLSIFSVWPLKAIQPLVPTLNHQSCKIISTLWRPWYYPQLSWKRGPQTNSMLWK